MRQKICPSNNPMTRRTKILIGITIGVLIVMAIVLYLLWKNRSVPQAGTPEAATPVSQGTTPGDPNISAPVAVPQQTTPFATAEATARSFVERWGSFSTESDFQNIEDLYALMTDSMRTWANTYLADQRKVQAAGVEFYGVTTRAMKTEVLEQSADSVRIRVTVQRVETKGSAQAQSSYKTMEVALKHIGQAWFIDGAWWK